MFTFYRQRPFSPSVPAEAGCLFAVAACVHAFISGESVHCFLDGVNKSYVIAASDLWLFIHASNLLPSLPTPLPYSRKPDHCICEDEATSQASIPLSQSNPEPLVYAIYRTCFFFFISFLYWNKNLLPNSDGVCARLSSDVSWGTM